MYEIPAKIKEEVGSLISSLLAAGWKLDHATYDEECFGNWFVDLSREDATIRLVKDRSQWCVRGPTHAIKAAGLFKAFDDLDEFRRAISDWAIEKT